MYSPTIEIESYIQTAEKTLVRVADLNGPVPDFLYVEGAIELRIGDTEMLTKRDSDLVILLWEFLLVVLVDACQKGSGRSCFPDQPTEMRARLLPRAQLELLIVEHATRRVVVPAIPFLGAIADAADKFCKELERSNPQLVSRVDMKNDIRALRGEATRLSHIR